MSLRTGKCACEAVAYTVEGDPLLSALCHCPSCRKTSGAPVVAWAMFPKIALAFVKGAPAQYESSPGVLRSFCQKCGTPLAFEADYIDGLVDITIASFDSPESIEPQMHIWNRHALPWMKEIESLTAYEELPPQAN